MKNFFQGLVLLFLAVPVAAQSDQGDDSIVFEGLNLRVCEAYGRKYEFVVTSSTARVKSAPYEDFGGVTLCFDRDQFERVEAVATYEFGVLQYLFDDRPAEPLQFAKNYGPIALDVEIGTIRLPQTYSNIDGEPSIHDLLGFSNFESLAFDLEKDSFYKIKDLSLSRQRKFYSEQLENNRKQLEECCPEYIEQAEKFLKLEERLVSDFSELAVEVYRKSTVIEIHAQPVSGESTTYKIIDSS